MTGVHNDVDSPWMPLPVLEVQELMRGARFFWCLAGGLAIERVVGRSYRTHDDTDIVVLRPDQLALQGWLTDWHLAVADPPGCLRPWTKGERMPSRAHDVWGHRPGSRAWELQVMIQEADGDVWYYRTDDRVNGRIADLATTVDDVPCLRMDLQLLFKAKSSRPKDEMDFQQMLPFLSEAERLTLATWLRLTCPNGHHWITALEDGVAS
jgi:hypothetical protein